jgi:DNA polymerase-1
VTKGCIDAFAHGMDVHRATAAEVFGVAIDAGHAPMQRRSAKAINFGLIYGMSAFGLAKQLGIGRAEAQAYIDRYFARYPGVRRLHGPTRAQARREGLRRNPVRAAALSARDPFAQSRQRRQAAERTAINAPMQGSAADIIKRAMIAVDAWLRRQRLPGDAWSCRCTTNWCSRYARMQLPDSVSGCAR